MANRRGLPRWQAFLAMLAVAGAITAAWAAPAAAAYVPGHYSVSANGGATFGLQTSHNLVSGQVDDQLFYLQTTGTGLSHLPFPIQFYNKSYARIAISSNGNIQLGVAPGGGSAAFTNDCLATTTFPRATVMPYWDDLFFDSNDTSHGFTEGIFVKTKGSAPNRKFIVSWQGHEFGGTGALVLANALFKEGSQTITFTYGLNGGASATVGVQAHDQLASTQWTCNSGSTTAVISGMKLTWLHSG
jgi:hypothetical protein